MDRRSVGSTTPLRSGGASFGLLKRAEPSSFGMDWTASMLLSTLAPGCMNTAAVHGGLDITGRDNLVRSILQTGMTNGSTGFRLVQVVTQPRNR